MVPATTNKMISSSQRPYASIYPQQYIAYRSPSSSSSSGGGPPIIIDGNLDKPFWNEVNWSDDFVDIATDTKPKFRTRIKMRWDDDFLYVGAYMEEKDVWATLKQHNSVIFHDNDFEVFVDTDGSNHNYKEFEINAFGVSWSLLLDKPYDDGGGENSKRVKPENGYDMKPPLLSATKVYPNDAINQPGAPNTHWTAEIALPISKMMEHNPNAKRPADGIFWRINFSRVQWCVKVDEDGKYVKHPCCQSCATPGKAAEDNWVWSKQGEVAMHLPERWGVLQFESSPSAETKYYDEWTARCSAVAIYYAEKRFKEKEGRYTTDIEALKAYSAEPFPISDEADISISVTSNGYEARATIDSYTATVNEERYLVVTTQKICTTTTLSES